MRNSRLNQTAYSLYLFVRDVADGDLVGWIDAPPARGRSAARPRPSGLPRTWDEIEPGHFVIAQESAENGWWEADLHQARRRHG